MKILNFCLLLVGITLPAVNSSPVESSTNKLCDDGLGVCTAENMCDKNLAQFTDGSSFLNVRFAADEDEPCHYLQVCCEPENVIKKENIIETPVEAIIKAELEADNHSKTPNNHVDNQSRTDNNDNDSDAEHDHKKRVVISTGNCNSLTHECIAQNMCNDGLVHGDHAPVDCSVASHVCCEKSKNIVRFVPTECGLSNKDGVAFHVTNNVDESQFGEFPWVAALLEKNEIDESYKYFCAGSLIHPNVVLTAAHCVNGKNKDNLKVRLGEWDTQTEFEPLPYFEKGVESITIHEEFNPSNLFNDFALIKLTHPVPLTAHINTICLSPSNVKFDGDRCFGTGWGKDDFFSSSYRTNLKRVEMPVVPVADCQSKLRQTRLGTHFRLNNSFMCAGGEQGKDLCVGDGGAALFCPNPQKENGYYQVGIVAWGIECGNANVPGVYANVVKGRQWIDDRMIQFGYGTESYTPKY